MVAGTHSSGSKWRDALALWAAISSPPGEAGRRASALRVARRAPRASAEVTRTVVLATGATRSSSDGQWPALGSRQARCEGSGPSERVEKQSEVSLRSPGTSGMIPPNHG